MAAERVDPQPPEGVEPLTIDIPVRFSDIDGMGHVNNARFLSYTEEARTAWALRDLKAKSQTELHFILAHARLDFRSPANLGDVVRVEMWVPRIGNKSWDFAYRLTEATTGILLSTASTTQASYDYRSGRTVPISDTMMAAIKKYAAPS